MGSGVLVGSLAAAGAAGSEAAGLQTQLILCPTCLVSSCDFTGRVHILLHRMCRQHVIPTAQITRCTTALKMHPQYQVVQAALALNRSGKVVYLVSKHRLVNSVVRQTRNACYRGRHPPASANVTLSR